MSRVISFEEQNLIWHTDTLIAWTQLNYDKILFYDNVVGIETYITTGAKEDVKHIEGYEARKLHKKDKVETVYFIRTEDLAKLPIIIQETTKIHSRQRVFNLVTKAKSLEIRPEKILDWREIIDYSGIPYHTHPLDFTRYKLKRLYGRLQGKFYARYVSESGFGKDKFSEAYRLLLHKLVNISDPSRAKIFYSACHNREITINELGVPKGEEQAEYFNLMMRIGDGTGILDNSKRAKDGTSESIFIDKLSVCFTHNIAEYYLKKGKKCFEQVYTYNILNRYYPNDYKGYSQMQLKPRDVTHQQIAIKHDRFIKDWIKSVLWYEEHFHELPNKYAYIPLEGEFLFKKKEDRYKTHFHQFAHCVSHYAKDEKEYLEILRADYDNHKAYVEKMRVYEEGEEEKLIVIEEKI